MSVREKTAVLVRCNDLERRLVETEQCLAAAEIQIALLETINGKWQDETKLTLDVLRRELGEPLFHTSSEIVSWNVDGDIVLLPNAASRWAKVGGRVVEGKVETLGQLRRILSVLEEITPGGGDAAK